MTFFSRVFLLSLSILLFSVSVRAVAPVHQWSQRFGDTSADLGSDVAVDASGNVIVTGYFRGTVDLGGGNLTSAGFFDMFVAKYDASGAHQWSRRFGSTGDDEGRAVAVDASGNVIVTGLFEGAVDFGGGNLTSADSTDILVAKYAPNGVHQWSRRFGGTGVDRGLTVAVDASGNVIVAGLFKGTVNFGGGNLTSAGDLDIFVAKYDASGVHQWSRSFGGADRDLQVTVALDASGNVMVTGGFRGTVNFGGGNLTSAGIGDIFLAKYDASGVHQWSQRFGDTTADVGFGIAVDASGNAIVTGTFSGTVDFGGGNLTSAGANDIFVAKYDAGGVHQWSKRFGDVGSDLSSGATVDASGNVIVTGSFEGTVDFGGGNLTSAGFNDIFIAKYDASGVHQWSQRFGDTDAGGDHGRAIAADASGNVIATGWFRGTVDFGGGNLVSAGSVDIFLAKYGDVTVPVFISYFGATPRGLAVDVAWRFRSDEALDRFTLYRRHGASPAVIVASGDALATRSYTDTAVEPGETYRYELVIRTAGGDEFHSPFAIATVARLAASLSQNFPNPFNPQTTIEYTVGAKAMVSIEIFDASGALVTRLHQGDREAGTYRAEWDGRDGAGRPVASGIYFYRLAGVRGGDVRKMVLLK
ncbi:MAG: FlgD immunoglobulin-like domain containing protein [Candidatus Krumholzibacteriia bacterium]